MSKTPDKEEIKEMHDVVSRQTDYSKEEILLKLIKHNYNTTNIIKEYMGIDVEKKYEIKSVNQEIYRQMRLTLDAATKDFNDKQYEKIKKEWQEEEEKNKTIMESVNEEEEVIGKIANCDLCCEDKSFETYYRFTRGRQELFSCVKCWETRETQLVAHDSWAWEKCTYPGPAFYTVNNEEEEKNKAVMKSVKEEEQ